MNKEYNALKFYMKLILFATIYIGIMTIVNYQSYGEAQRLVLKLDRISIFFALVVQCLTLIFAYFFFLKTKDVSLNFDGKKYKLVMNERKIHIFVCIILIAQIIFTIITGNGVVGLGSTSNLSTLFNIFNIKCFMPIYYIVARDIKKRQYWVNIILYIIYEFLCGWTGFILIIAIYELFLYLKYGKRKKMLNSFFKFGSIAVIAGYIVGGGIYSFAAAFKDMIRYGYDFEILSFQEGLNRLLSRLTNFPITILGIQNHSSIAKLYCQQGKPLWEIEAIFKSLLPGSLMPNKSYRVLGNLVLQSLYPTITNGCSTGYCMWVYWANLAEADLASFILFVLIVVLLMIISKKIVYAFDKGNKDVEVLYFLLVFNLFNGSPIESLFAYNYIGLIYILPIMIIMGIVKIERSSKFETKR